MKKSVLLKLLFVLFVAIAFAFSLTNFCDDDDLQLDPICLFDNFYQSPQLLHDQLNSYIFIGFYSAILPESTTCFLAMHETSPPVLL